MLVAMLFSFSEALAGDAPAASVPLQAIATLEARSGSRMTGTVTFIQGDAMPGAGMPQPQMPGMGHGGMDHPGMGQPASGQPATSPTATGVPIQVSIRLVDAAPGNHAVFLHATGDCSAPDASSAGNYYGGITPAAPPTPAQDARPGSIGAPAEPGQDNMPGSQGSATGMPGTGTALAGPPAGYIGFVTVGPEGRGEKDLTVANYMLTEGEGSVLNRAVVVYEKAPDFTANADAGARQACGVIRKYEGAPLGTE